MGRLKGEGRRGKGSEKLKMKSEWRILKSNITYIVLLALCFELLA